MELSLAIEPFTSSFSFNDILKQNPKLLTLFFLDFIQNIDSVKYLSTNQLSQLQQNTNPRHKPRYTLKNASLLLFKRQTRKLENVFRRQYFIVERATLSSNKTMIIELFTSSSFSSSDTVRPILKSQTLGFFPFLTLQIANTEVDDLEGAAEGEISCKYIHTNTNHFYYHSNLYPLSLTHFNHVNHVQVNHVQECFSPY